MSFLLLFDFKESWLGIPTSILCELFFNSLVLSVTEQRFPRIPTIYALYKVKPITGDQRRYRVAALKINATCSVPSEARWSLDWPSMLTNLLRERILKIKIKKIIINKRNLN